MTKIVSKFCQLETSKSLVSRVAVEILIASAGITLLLITLGADRNWLDRHFMPAIFTRRHVYVLAASIARVVMTVLGAALIFVARPRVGRFVARMPPGRLVADLASVSLAV